MKFSFTKCFFTKCFFTKCSIDHSTALKALLFLAAIGSTSCDTSKTKIQYVPDMADAPTLKPQENYLERPEHAVPLYSMVYPKTKEEAATLLQDPLPPGDPKVLQLGEKMWNTYCIPCHGAAGKSDGSIVDVYVRPPDITDPAYHSVKDGSLFHTITFGQNIMPGYGHATQIHERWAIVRYIRKLQGIDPAAQGGSK
jgi:hypothetical protein